MEIDKDILLKCVCKHQKISIEDCEMIDFDVLQDSKYRNCNYIMVSLLVKTRIVYTGCYISEYNLCARSKKIKNIYDDN